jgi:cytochrome c-type biogenesis protein CcmH
MRARQASLLLFGLLVIVPAKVLAQAETVPGEAAVFAAYRPPCCYQQTLDIHASSEADALRREIRAMLRAGETRRQVDEMMVRRYGPAVLAVPPGIRLEWVAIGVMGAGLVALASVLRWVGSMVRRSADQASPRFTARNGARDELDDQIDEELREMNGGRP